MGPGSLCWRDLCGRPERECVEHGPGNLFHRHRRIDRLLRRAAELITEGLMLGIYQRRPSARAVTLGLRQN